MSDERHPASVSDSSAATRVDRDLAQLLSIAPSAEFVGRVRQRIRDEAGVRPSRTPWWVPVAFAATVVLAILFASRAWWTQRVPRDVSTAGITEQPASGIPPASHAAALVPQPPQIAQRRPKGIQPVAARTSDTASKAEVLVSRDQLRAIARLQELVAKGDLTDANAPPVGSDREAVTDIRPAPLTIAPLTVPAVETVTGGEGSKARLER
ncbi:MAG TPA: hypothetical protein VFZ98_01760 [Vicinamibacterales bacterium]